MATLPDERSLGERPAIRTSGATASIGGATGYEGVAARNQLGVANDLTNTGDILQKAQNDYDQLTAQDAINKLNAKRLALENEAKKVQGADAANPEFYGKMRQQFDDAASGVSESLTPNQKRYFQPHAAQSGLMFQSSILNHVAHQSEVNADNIYKGTIEGNLQIAAQKWDDSNEFQAAILGNKTATAAMAARKGLPKELVDQINSRNEQEAWRGRIEMMRENDPTAALKILQDNPKNFDFQHYSGLYNKVALAAAPPLAAWLNQNGGPGVMTKPQDIPATQSFDPLKVARPVRNNNPVAVRRNDDNAWQGKVNGTDPEYETFDTPEAGVRASALLLLKYQADYKLNSVSAMISKYAPPDENNTAAYINDVSKALGVDPNASIDVKNPAVMKTMLAAMVKKENGKDSRYVSDATISAGADAALNGTALPKPQAMPVALKSPARSPDTITGNPLIDNLPADKKMHVIQMAQQMAQGKSNDDNIRLDQRIKDTVAEYMATGVATDPPTDGELIAIKGQLHGPAVANYLKDVAQVGQNIQALKTMPNGDIENLLKTNKPVAGDGFAERQQTYQHLVSAAENVVKQRQQDPGAYAIATKAYGWNEIKDFNDVAAVTKEFQARSSTAGKMATDYGVKQTILTDNEAKFLADTIKSQGVPVQKKYLASIWTGTNGDVNLYKSVMQKIAPNQPMLAEAGILQGRGAQHTAGTISNAEMPAGDTAELLLKGEAILNPGKSADGREGGKSLLKMPEEKALLNGWIAQIGTDTMRNKPEASSNFYESARRIYAGLSSNAGDESGVLNSGRWKAAILLATGGIVEHNGRQVVPPYGMPYDKFQNAIYARAESVAKQTVGFTANDIRSAPLENEGDGTYSIRTGAGYVLDKKGQRVILNLNLPDGVAPLPKPQGDNPAYPDYIMPSGRRF